MKNIRGKSVKKSRDWIQEKKVKIHILKTEQIWNAEMGQIWNAEICRTVPGGRGRMSDQTQSSPAEREKTNFDATKLVKVFFYGD